MTSRCRATCWSRLPCAQDAAAHSTAAAVNATPTVTGATSRSVISISGTSASTVK